MSSLPDLDPNLMPNSFKAMRVNWHIIWLGDESQLCNQYHESTSELIICQLFVLLKPSVLNKFMTANSSLYVVPPGVHTHFLSLPQVLHFLGSCKLTNNWYYLSPILCLFVWWYTFWFCLAYILSLLFILVILHSIATKVVGIVTVCKGCILLGQCQRGGIGTSLGDVGSPGKNFLRNSIKLHGPSFHLIVLNVRASYSKPTQSLWPEG